MMAKRLLASCALLLPVGVRAQASPFGHQAQNANGLSNFGGAMVYDEERHALLLTGQTYGSYLDSGDADVEGDTSSNCYLTMLQMKRDPQDPQFDVDNDEGGVTFASTFGNVGVRETCRSIALLDDKAFLGGWSDPEGTLQPLWSSGNLRPPQYGTILDVDFLTTEAGDGDTILRGGELIRNTEGAQSTEAMVVSKGGQFLYVASWESEVAEEAAQSGGCLDHKDVCNYSTGGAVVRGKDYLVNVVRYTIEQNAPTGSNNVEQTLKPTWDREIATTYQVEVSGLLMLDESTLFLAGSAIGHDDAIPQTDTYDGLDYDGYITKIDASDGRIVKGRRIESQPIRPDFVNHVCGRGPDLLFVVGTTDGTMNPVVGEHNDAGHERAFLMKINPDTLATDWFAEVKASGGGSDGNDGDVRGLRCGVTSDGLHVYVGGVVLDGAHLSKHAPKGQDDLWVAQYSAKDGEEGWMRQVGTQSSDSLVDMTTDKYGNVLLFANTKGSYMKKSLADDVTDTLVLSLTRNEGNYQAAVEDTEIPPSVTEPPVIPPPLTDAPEVQDPPTPSPEGEEGLTKLEPTASPRTPAPATNELVGAVRPPTTSGSSSRRKSAITALLIVMSICVVLIGCFVWQQRNQKEDNYTDSNAQVLDYLKGFENVEVDLKHSATGGWHGTYVNNDGAPKFLTATQRRHTTNIPPSEVISFDNEMEPFVRDSLFADDDDDPTTLGTNTTASGSLTRQSSQSGCSSYGGLVDAYNTTWDDLSPHTLPRGKLGGTPKGSAHNSPRQSFTATRKSLDRIELAHGTVRMQDVHLEDDGDSERAAWGREII